MAGKIPAGELVTRSTLDATQPTKTLKELKSNVSGLTSAWKAQTAELKSAGDSLGAAKTKYEGLSQSVKSQQEYLARLKSEQSGVDRTTNEGAEQYAKLGKQIATAATKLNSMTAQQSRAKQSMDYYKSGLSSAQDELRKISTVSSSYVERLRAEGKQGEANKTELKSLGDQYARMYDIYTKQSAELDKIAKESGKSSDAYAKQAIRVNEMGTKMAQTKSHMADLNDTIRKANPTVFDRLKSKITLVNQESAKTPGIFKKIVAGGLVTNAISSGFTAATSAIKETIQSGLELNEAGEELTNTWSAMGKSDKEIAALSTQMSNLRAKTGDSAGEVNILQRTIDTMTNGDTTKTMAVTQGIAAIGTASRLGGQGVDGLGKSMSRVIASGNLTTSSLARLEKQAPTMGAQLAKAAGMSQSAFAKLVASGKITSSQFLGYITKVGANSKDVFDKFGKTSKGALAQISGSWMTLKGKMTAPLLDVKNTGMSSLSQILTSSVVQDAATQLGKGIAQIANKGERILEYIAKHKTDVTGIASDMWQIAKIAGGTVWSVFKSVISDIAQWLNVGGKNAKSMKDPLGTIHDILDKLVKNKSGIESTTKAILAIFAISKAVKFAAALGGIYTQLSNLKSVGKVSDMLVSLTGGSTKLGGTLQSASSAGGYSALTTAGKVGSGIAAAGVAVDAVSSISQAFSDKKGSKKQYEDAGSGIGSAIGGGIGLWFGGPLGAALGSQIGKLVGKWGGGAAKKFSSGWNAVGKGKKPKGWLAGVGWDARKMTNSVVKWWDDTNKKAQKANAAQAKAEAKQQKAQQKQWNAYWSGVSKGWTRFWSKTTKGANKWAASHLSTIAKNTTATKKNWDGFWSDTSKNWSGFWSGVGKKSSSAMDSMRKLIARGSDKISSGWNTFTKGLGSAFTSIWSGIKSAARNSLNGVISIINDAIGAINGVWKFFTGKKALGKISKLAQGGVIRGEQRLVMVNDDGSSHYKELIQLPTGQLGMFQGRNQKAILPEGTRVFNGKQTQQIMGMAGIEHYAGGGIVGGIESLIGKAADKASAITDWLLHPAKSVENMIAKGISGASAGLENFTSFGVSIVHKLEDAIVAWFKKHLKPLADEGESNPSGSGVKRWKSDVVKALKANGLSTSDSMVAKVMRQIQTESGGNPKAVQGNIGDINNITGDLAKGLMQTISTTFNHYAFPGHKNIFNGYDNLLAALAYAKSRYGASLSFLGQGHGYANGGFAATPSVFGEGGLEAAIPLSAIKSSRGYEMLGKTAAAMAARDGVGGSSTDMKVLSDKLDTLIGLLQTLTSGSIQLLQQIAAKELNLDHKQVTKRLTPSLSAEMQRRQMLANGGVAIVNNIN